MKTCPWCNRRIWFWQLKIRDCDGSLYHMECLDAKSTIEMFRLLDRYHSSDSWSQIGIVDPKLESKP